MRLALAAIGGCLALAAPGGATAAQWSAELFAGTAWSLPSPLAVRQPGQPELRLRARYDTHPFSGAPYYAWRAARFAGERGWEIEQVHHKLHLANVSPAIEHFEVSHGYNLLTLNRATRTRSGDWRLGLGMVVAHPEGRVRGAPVGPVASLLGGGYHLAGIASQLAVSRPLALGRGFALVPELKLSGSWARVPLAGGGSATVPCVALHAHAGLGFAR